MKDVESLQDQYFVEQCPYCEHKVVGNWYAMGKKLINEHKNGHVEQEAAKPR